MKIILFRGRPGVGKTTISNAFSKKTNFSILRKDDIYDVTSEFIEDHQTRNKISYGSLYKILESNSSSNCTFILDYPFHSTQDFSIIKEWCINKKVELKSVVVTCSDEKVWAQRFNVRSENPQPNQLITDFEELKKYYGDMQIKPESDELLIDTIEPTDALVSRIMSFIN